MANVSIECCVVNGAVYYKAYDGEGNFLVSADSRSEAEYEIMNIFSSNMVD